MGKDHRAGFLRSSAIPDLRRFGGWALGASPTGIAPDGLETIGDTTTRFAGAAFKRSPGKLGAGIGIAHFRVLVPRVD